MTSMLEIVQGVTPYIYAEVAAQQRLRGHTDMSRSNLCHYLTLGLLAACEGRGMPARREEHLEPEGRWHYLIAHVEPEAEPQPADLITDMNPWQWGASRHYTGILHAPRHEVQEILSSAGAPEWFVGLRGIQTIQRQHTLNINPYVGS